MILRLAFLALSLCWFSATGPMAQTATPQVARVTTGEHGAFTRVVVELDTARDWRVGRDADGYVLALGGPQEFDLSGVFTRIDRRRLAGLRPDPATGSLHLALGCACHAMPFEFRPGIVVIDLRDGPPPPGSSFEDRIATPSDPVPRGPLRQGGGDRPPAGFDWRALALSDLRHAPDAPPPTGFPTLESGLVRDRLLREFGRAASQGLLVPATDFAPATPRPRDGPSGANLRIGPALTARPADASPAVLAADGQTCPADERLAVTEWGDDRPAAHQLADAATGLTGEFDRPNPEAVARAIRLHLRFGFGAEAAALLAAFPTGHPDGDLWQSMARLVDGLTDPSGPFGPYAACDGAASLWALLADPATRSPVNVQAVIRTLSALPPDLRRHLGPILAESRVKAGDIPTATALAEAIRRLPGAEDDQTAILSARLAEAQGDLSAARQSLQPVLQDPGPEQPSALVALVRLHARDAAPVGSDVVTALQSYLAEAEGTPAEQELRIAVMLGAALAGDTDLAFTLLPDVPEAAPDLWHIMATAPDSAILMHAMGAPVEGLPRPTRQAMAERIARLGFPDESWRWRGEHAPAPLTADDPQDDPLRERILARDWSNLPGDAPDFWQAAAGGLTPPETGLPDTPLARSRKLAETAAATRADIERLLQSVPPP